MKTKQEMEDAFNSAISEVREYMNFMSKEEGYVDLGPREMGFFIGGVAVGMRTADKSWSFEECALVSQVILTHVRGQSSESEDYIPSPYPTIK